MSAAGTRYMHEVRKLSCLICRKMGIRQESPTAAHHCFDTTHRSDFLTVPLCYEHHQGAGGFHGLGQRAFEMRYKTDETHLVGETIGKII